MTYPELHTFIPNLGWSPDRIDTWSVSELLDSAQLSHALATHIYNPEAIQIEAIMREGFANPGDYTALAIHEPRILPYIRPPRKMLIVTSPMRLPHEADRFWSNLRTPLKKLSLPALVEVCPSGAFYHSRRGQNRSFGFIPPENILKLVGFGVEEWIESTSNARMSFIDGVPESDVHAQLLKDLYDATFEPLLPLNSLREVSSIIKEAYVRAITFSVLLESVIPMLECSRSTNLRSLGLRVERLQPTCDQTVLMKEIVMEKIKSFSIYE